MRLLLGTLALVLLAVPCLADTTVIAPNTYKIDEGVAFSITNDLSTNFEFTWTDGSGTWADKEDPTLVLVEGQTYTFTRTTSSHPFVITDDTLPVTENFGYVRDTTSGTVIDNATLTPIADFTADPAPTSDFIEWTPTVDEIGDYYYTCRVTHHVSMTGVIRVVSSTVSVEESSISGLKAGFVD